MNLADLRGLDFDAYIEKCERDLERRDCQKLSTFVERAWHVLEPGTDYSGNWHIDVICEHLEAVSRGEIKNLLINVPPGCMKSLLVSVMWPAWEWTQDQSIRYFAASYSETISLRDNLKCRDLLRSEWYQGLWPGVTVRKDLDRATKYALEGGGWRLATSVRGSGTGEHPDRKLVDDPSNVKESESDVERQASLDWFDRTLATRGASRGAATVVIMQRLHEKDLSGHIMARSDFKANWTHLCFPMEYEGDRSQSKLMTAPDKRKVMGELLWPALHTKKIVDTLKISLGDYGAAGQLQQNPSPAGGGIIKVENFQIWSLDLPIPNFEYVLQSYDTAFTDKTINDPTACTVWGLFRYRDKYNVMLMDAWSEHMEFPELRARVIEEYSEEYGGDPKDIEKKARRADTVLIEDKGSGISLLQDIRQARVPVFPYNPGNASKIARAHLVAPLLQTGVVYIMESKKEPGKPVLWARPLLKQCEQFPNAEHDDYVDTLTQAIRYFKDTGMLELPEATDDPEDFDVEDRRKARNPYDA